MLSKNGDFDGIDDFRHFWDWSKSSVVASFIDSDFLQKLKVALDNNIGTKGLRPLVKDYVTSRIASWLKSLAYFDDVSRRKFVQERSVLQKCDHFL